MRGKSSKRSHRGADLVSADAEWEAALERGDKEAWGVDSAATPLPFGSFTWDSYGRSATIYVSHDQTQRFRYTGAELLHRRNGETVASVQTYEHGDHRVFIGRHRLFPHYAWQLDFAVPSDVGDVSEVQHHPQIPNDETHSPRFVTGGEFTDPVDNVAYREMVDGPVAKRLKQYAASDSVGGEGAVSHSPAGSQPLRMDFFETYTARDGATHLRFGIKRGGKPVTYQVLADDSFTPGPERTSVLDLRIATTSPVPDVESSPVPGVPSTNVESRHQP
jgi:hypothetical protein